MSAVSAVLPSLLACCEQEIQQILGAQQQQQQQQPQEEGASNALVLLDALLSLWILYTITGVAKDPQLLQVRRISYMKFPYLQINPHLSYVPISNQGRVSA
jgi:hypothetical protein